jgi:hypothetical protein
VEWAGLAEVFLMFLAGILISEATGARDKRANQLERKLEKNLVELEELRLRNDQAREVIGELQKRIVDKGTSMAAVRELTLMFSSTQPHNLYRALLQCIAKELGAEACALYLRGPNSHLLCSLGYPEILPGRVKMADECGLLAQAISEGRVVTLRDLLQSPEGCRSAQPVMMAGPLKGPDGEVLGAVAVERMPLLKLTPTSVRLLEAILDLCSQSLNRAVSPVTSFATSRHRADRKEAPDSRPGDAHAFR